MVEILDPLERDCDHLSYGEIYYSCVENREDYHPMFVDAWSCTCRVYEISSY